MPEQNATTSPHTRIRRQGQRMTAEEKRIAQATFLEAFANTANVRAACKKASIDRSQVYRWQEHDEQFSLRFKQAEAEANDMLRAAAWRRGVEGVEEPVISMGTQVYTDGKPLTKRVYSDMLLSLLMKARMPEFREKSQVDVNANVSGEVKRSDISDDLRLLTNEQLAQFKAWVYEAKQD